jgi:hypothetical protein
VRNLLLLIAIFATIVVAGCWDNQRNMQHVLDDGYPAIVEITGAQFQRFAPFALDGWRPRFVEQSLSVDLKWDGKDGKPHQYRKVPVTETFAGTIVSGEQVKLAILPGKVLDDGHAVPVINADAAPRFASLQEWITTAASVAGVAWMGFAALTIWTRRRGAGTTGVAISSESLGALPPRRTLVGLVALLVGAVLTFHAWSVEEAGNPDASDGIETTAEITTALTIGGSNGATSHVVQLAWKDAQGGVHHFGPVRISEAFWNKITRDGVLIVHETRIRYSGEGAEARPALVEDKPEMSWQVQAGLGVGVVLIGFGAACLLSAARRVRRRTAPR